MQPDVDYMVYYDSEWPYATRDSLGNYMTNTLSAASGGGTAFNVMAGGEYLAGVSPLSVFDEWGGTYYGDADPPDGCDHCLIKFVPRKLRGVLRLASMFSPSSANTGTTLRPISSTANPRTDPKDLGYRSSGVRKSIYIPYPNAFDNTRIIANLVAGVSQTHMDLGHGWEDLNLKSGAVMVRSVEYIRSLGDRADYYLIWLQTQAGQPYAVATVSREGWLLSASVVLGSSVEPTRDISLDEAAVQAKLGLTTARAERVYLPTTLGGGPSAFRPFTAVETSIGPVYVDYLGRLYREDPSGNIRAGFRGRRSALRQLTQ